jgi:hypothetical protein
LFDDIEGSTQLADLNAKKNDTVQVIGLQTRICRKKGGSPRRPNMNSQSWLSDGTFGRKPYSRFFHFPHGKHSGGTLLGLRPPSSNDGHRK